VRREETMTQTKFPVELLTEVGRESAELLLKNPKFWVQKKLDGHRRQFELFSDGRLVSYNRDGESVSYPNQLAGAFARLKYKSFIIDGELVGDVFFAFDLLQRNGVILTPDSFHDRFQELCREIQSHESPLLRVAPTFLTTKSKTAAIAAYYEDCAEGVVFRRIDAPYCSGRSGQHFKFKFWKLASCIVTAVGRDGKATIDIAMADLERGKFIPVGRCSINGKKTTPKPGDIVEVKYLYATKAIRLYQPEFKRLRDDQVPQDCDLQQLQFKEGVI
jgi:bifunctional non-homologous end joining protein LigD